MRFCIIDTSGNKVVNAVDYDAPPANPPPGFSATCIAVQSDTGNIGDSWNGTAIVPAPTPPPSPQQLCTNVDSYRDTRLANGFADTGTGGTGKTWQCDDKSVAKWDAIAASAGLNVLRGAPYNATTYTLIAADNSEITLAAPDASALLEQRVMAWVSATTLYGRQMKNNILAGNPPADITQGWP